MVGNLGLEPLRGAVLGAHDGPVTSRGELVDPLLDVRHRLGEPTDVCSVGVGLLVDGAYLPAKNAAELT